MGWLEDVQNPDHTPGPLCPQCPHAVISHGSGEICAAGCDHCDCPLSSDEAGRLAGGV